MKSTEASAPTVKMAASMSAAATSAIFRLNAAADGRGAKTWCNYASSTSAAAQIKQSTKILAGASQGSR